MNIALLGYGRMGQIIEQIALDRGHQVTLKIDKDNQNELNVENLGKADVAIDFSIPTAAYSNIIKCFEANTPIVSGTTGWMDRYDEVSKLSKEQGKGFFYASNYSVGVNVFFKVNQYLAKVMNKIAGYEVDMEEVHHIHKLDAPSGTAITLAEGIINEIDKKKEWVLDKSSDNRTIGIKAIREDEVPGIHKVTYDSEVDFIHIEHSAKSRKGFALGAVLAAEYMNGKTGFHSMDDMLNID